MIPPPDNISPEFVNLYYEMQEEIQGKNFQHDEYQDMGAWMLVYIIIENKEFQKLVDKPHQ